MASNINSGSKPQEAQTFDCSVQSQRHSHLRMAICLFRVDCCAVCISMYSSLCAAKWWCLSLPLPQCIKWWCLSLPLPQCLHISQLIAISNEFNLTGVKLHISCIVHSLLAQRHYQWNTYIRQNKQDSFKKIVKYKCTERKPCFIFWAYILFYI